MNRVKWEGKTAAAGGDGSSGEGRGLVERTGSLAGLCKRVLRQLGLSVK